MTSGICPASPRAATGTSTRRLTRIIVIVATLLLHACAEAAAAGHAIQRITDSDRERPIQIDLWYPTEDAEKPHAYALGAGSVAREAPVTGRGLPLIVFSHGAFGAASNYAWLAEHLARAGYFVMGVSHFGESPVFGPQPVGAPVLGLDERVSDLRVALDFLLHKSPYASALDQQRIVAMGHSSGGASVLRWAGASYSPQALYQYCASQNAVHDMGCRYAAGRGAAPAHASRDAVPEGLRALILLDPAVGPGFPESGLQGLRVPTLVVGARHNDFLPYPAHAGRISGLIPQARSVALDGQEGHFIFLNECALPWRVHGVELCVDRAGASRSNTHAQIRSLVTEFLQDQWKEKAR